MMRLALDDLHRADVAALERLARALGLRVRHPRGATVGQKRHALVFAIARAEKRLARQPIGGDANADQR